MNGALKCDYRGRLVVIHPDQRAGPQHRRGIFVRYTERWDAVQTTAPKPHMVVHFDETRDGRTRVYVDVGYRQDVGLDPVD